MRKGKKQKKTGKISSSLRPFICKYLLCKKEGTYEHILQLINEKNASVKLPFCRYHFYIVMGGHFKVKINKGIQNPDSFELIGPLKEVEIAEQVIAAREMITKLESNNKKK